MLRTVVSRFWERNSNVTVDVQMGGSEEAVEALMTGACDLALAFDVRLPRGVRRLATTELGIGALVTPNHRLAGRGAAQLRDFANEPVLLADMSLSLGRMVEELAAKEELELQIRARSNSIEELVAMAVQGLGTTFQIRAGVEREIERGELIYLPLSDRLLKPRKLSLLVYGQSRLPEAQAGLASLITEAMEALAAS
jgi:DNA-binding transcriptional LysR family regulator